MKHKVVVGIGVAILAVPLVALAFTSSDFGTKTASWVAATCTSKLVNSADTQTNDRTAAICYAVLKSQELTTLVNTQQQQIQSLQTTKSTTWVVDSRGSLIGTFLGTIPDNEGYENSYRIFIPSVNKWLPVRIDSGAYSFNLQYTKETSTVSFSTTDCSGQAYVKSPQYTAHTVVLDINQIINAGDNQNASAGRFFAVTSTQGSYVAVQSQLYNGVCSANSFSDNLLPASEIQLPFALPLTTPLMLQAQ